MKRLVLIDGHSLLFRAYHALPKTFRNSEGTPTNAVYGFMSMLIRLVNDLRPDYMAVAFDETGPTFRHQELLTYKEGRPEPEEDFSVQNPIIRNVLAGFAIPVFSISGYEGEDIIATIINKISPRHAEMFGAKHLDPSPHRGAQDNGKGNLEIFIVSGDRDVIQLIGKNVKVYYPKKGLSDTVVYDGNNAHEVFGVEPKKVPDFKGLRGDSSDKIPGVFGIGEKTAVNLINEFGSVESLYQNIGRVREKFGESVEKKLIEGAELAVLSKKMGMIVASAPITVKLSDLVFKGFDSKAGLEELRALGFKSLIKRMGFGEEGSPKTKKVVKKAEASQGQQALL